MGDARLTQLPVKVLVEIAPDVRLTQVAVKLLVSTTASAGAARLSQVAVKVLIPTVDPTVFVLQTQGVVEPAEQYDQVPARASQLAVDSSEQYDQPWARHSQLTLESGEQYPLTWLKARASQISVEFAYPAEYGCNNPQLIPPEPVEGCPAELPQPEPADPSICVGEVPLVSSAPAVGTDEDSDGGYLGYLTPGGL